TGANRSFVARRLSEVAHNSFWTSTEAFPQRCLRRRPYFRAPVETRRIKYEAPHTRLRLGVHLLCLRADALAVLNCSKLSASLLARGLLEQLGANQGLGQAEVQTDLRALSGVGQV